MHNLPTNRRLGLNEIRAWHLSKREARAIAADGILDVSSIMGYWGRVAWRVASPRCVFARARQRDDQRWQELHERLAAMPVPQPPAGHVWGFSNGTEYDRFMYRNCEGCALAGDVGEMGSSRCQIFEAIHDSFDGTLPIEIATRLEHPAPGCWSCPERVLS